MGRKKKKEEEPSVETSTAQAPVPVVPLPPPNGQSKTDPPEFLARIRRDVIEWAKECGLKPPFNVSGPDRVEYPRQGHGYAATIQEETGKCRMGSARYTSAGDRSYWTIDGIVTG